jgi:hypothetical protein
LSYIFNSITNDRLDRGETSKATELERDSNLLEI